MIFFGKQDVSRLQKYYLKKFVQPTVADMCPDGGSLNLSTCQTRIYISNWAT